MNGLVLQFPECSMVCCDALRHWIYPLPVLYRFLKLVNCRVICRFIMDHSANLRFCHLLPGPICLHYHVDFHYLCDFHCTSLCSKCPGVDSSALSIMWPSFMWEWGIDHPEFLADIQISPLNLSLIVAVHMKYSLQESNFILTMHWLVCTYLSLRPMLLAKASTQNPRDISHFQTIIQVLLI